jgi:hypothetical protein
VSDWTPALWGYALFTVCVFVLLALWASEVREMWGDEDEARRLARLAFAAPFWPLLLAFVVVYELIRLARLALGGAR